MSAGKAIVLITGGNGGIGYETALQLIQDATKHVIIGSRSAAKGEEAVKKLQSQDLPGSVEAVQLDVASHESIIAAAKKIGAEHGRIDALVNNAGIAMTPPGLSTAEMMIMTFTTNAVGPQLMFEEFQPLLEKSATTPRVVNVSSGVGSIAERLNPQSPIYHQEFIHYRASKTALNMVSANQAVVFGRVGGKVFAYDPGFTASNLSPHNTAENGAKETSVTAKEMVDLINGKRDSEHGQYVDGAGRVPW